MIRPALAALSLFAAVAPATAATPDWIAANRARILSDYMALLAIPNTAADTPNIRRNADHIVATMTKLGLAPRLLEGPDAKVPPAIYGEWRAPGARTTLVIYAHYDGSAANDRDWKSTRPFVPILRTDRFDRPGRTIAIPAESAAIDPDWRIYARSASDDKAGVMAILTAVAALKAEGRRPAFNLKIFFDGEEEAGSPHIAEILNANRDLLKSDGWIMVDGPAHPNGAPQAVLGVRGFVRVDVTIYGPTRPLHSGHYGNWAPNPALMLSQLLASMKDGEGRVTVAGFEDDVVPLTAAERAAIAAVPSAEAALSADLGLARAEGGGETLTSLINRPSLNIDGIRSADVGSAARNVIPSTAMATLDMRLVKGNDPVRQVAKLKAHAERQGYLVLDREPTAEERRQAPRIATLVLREGYAAARTALDHPLATRMISGMKAAGPVVVMPTMGGSLPLSVVQDTLDVPTVTMALWNHDNNQHGEDENLRLGHFWQGIAAVAQVMTTK